MRRIFAATLSLAFLAALSLSTVSAQKAAVSASAAGGPQLFPVEEIKPGMKGVGRTVFSGTEPEEFGVEILGVLPGFPAPRQSAIIARLTGPLTERTGVFGGMSGSPVYIDGRLVGAIAFSFPFSKEPIAGITPIKQMIDIFERGEGGERNAGRNNEPRKFSFTELASTDWKPQLPKPAVTGAAFVAPVATNSPLVSLLGQQLQPIATPVVFGGV
jgi:SpoIVB peptidase S55